MEHLAGILIEKNVRLVDCAILLSSVFYIAQAIKMLWLKRYLNTIINAVNYPRLFKNCIRLFFIGSILAVIGIFFVFKDYDIYWLYIWVVGESIIMYSITLAYDKGEFSFFGLLDHLRDDKKRTQKIRRKIVLFYGNRLSLPYRILTIILLAALMDSYLENHMLGSKSIDGIALTAYYDAEEMKYGEGVLIEEDKVTSEYRYIFGHDYRSTLPVSGLKRTLSPSLRKKLSSLHDRQLFFRSLYIITYNEQMKDNYPKPDAWETVPLNKEDLLYFSMGTWEKYYP